MVLHCNYVKVAELFELGKVKNNDYDQDVIIAYTFDYWEWIFLSLFLIKILWFINLKLSEQDNLTLFW